MRTPLEKFYFKKEEKMKEYLDKLITRYEPYLTAPAGRTWASFSFHTPYWKKNNNYSLIMLSLWHDRINFYAIYWHNEEEIKKEERTINSYYDYINMIHYIDKVKNLYK